MSFISYRVHVVIDPVYGERLRELPVDEAVWVVDTEANRPVIERLWKERASPGHLEGITSFKHSSQNSPEDWFVEELSSIDLHHGQFSHDPPYSVLNVIGVAYSDTLRKALKKYGFTEYEQTTEGFVTWKKTGQQIVPPDR